MVTAARALRNLAFIGTIAFGSAGAAQANEQLRRLVEKPLKRVGVSSACIQSLDSNALSHIYLRTHKSVRTGSRSLKRRNEIRTFVRRYCPDL